MCALRACSNLCLLNETDTVEQHWDNVPLLRIFIKMFCRCVNSHFIILRPEKSEMENKPAVLAEIKKKGPQNGHLLTENRKRKEEKHLIPISYKKLWAMPGFEPGTSAPEVKIF